MSNEFRPTPPQQNGQPQPTDVMLVVKYTIVVIGSLFMGLLGGGIGLLISSFAFPPNKFDKKFALYCVPIILGGAVLNGIIFAMR